MNKLKLRTKTILNYAYYTIFFETEEQLLTIEKLLKANDILPRRYFYPSLDDLPYVDSNNFPIAKDIAQRVICLPLYKELQNEDLNRILKITNR